MSAEAGMEKLLSAERLSHTFLLCIMSDDARHKIGFGVNDDIDSEHYDKFGTKTKTHFSQ